MTSSKRWPSITTACHQHPQPLPPGTQAPTEYTSAALLMRPSSITSCGGRRRKPAAGPGPGAARGVLGSEDTRGGRG